MVLVVIDFDDVICKYNWYKICHDSGDERARFLKEFEHVAHDAASEEIINALKTMDNTVMKCTIDDQYVNLTWTDNSITKGLPHCESIHKFITNHDRMTKIFKKRNTGTYLFAHTNGFLEEMFFTMHNQFGVSKYFNIFTSNEANKEKFHMHILSEPTNIILGKFTSLEHFLSVQEQDYIQLNKETIYDIDEIEKIIGNIMFAKNTSYCWDDNMQVIQLDIGKMSHKIYIELSTHLNHGHEAYIRRYIHNIGIDASFDKEYKNKHILSIYIHDDLHNHTYDKEFNIIIHLDEIHMVYNCISDELVGILCDDFKSAMVFDKYLIAVVENKHAMIKICENTYFIDKKHRDEESINYKAIINMFIRTVHTSNDRLIRKQKITKFDEHVKLWDKHLSEEDIQSFKLQFDTMFCDACEEEFMLLLD